MSRADVLRVVQRLLGEENARDSVRIASGLKRDPIHTCADLADLCRRGLIQRVRLTRHRDVLGRSRRMWGYYVTGDEIVREKPKTRARPVYSAALARLW